MYRHMSAIADRRALELDDSSSNQFLQEDSNGGVIGAIGKIDSWVEDDDAELGQALQIKMVAPPNERPGIGKGRETISREEEEEDVLVSGKNEPNDTRLYSNPGERNSAVSQLVNCDDDDDDDDEIIDTVLMTDAPLPHPAYSLTKSLVAKTMSKLSMKQREEVYHDIHGVQDAIDEDAEEGFLDRKLSEMDDEIRKMEPSKKTAYEMARSANKQYVDDREFRLRFLRADRFNPQHAATRYTKHYQAKLELFGEDKLGREIFQDDLGSEGMDNLYSGMNQILPRRDNAGRLVWIWITGAQQQTHLDDAPLRRMFYNNMLISEDVETQRKGSVGIFYTLNQQQTRRGSRGNKFLRRLSDMVGSLPMSIVGIHFCYDNYTWLPVLSIVQLSIHLFVRLRIRAHFGTHRECVFQLQTFGIPADAMPIGQNGKFKRDSHVRFLQKRREQEQEWVARQGESSSNNTSKKKSDADASPKIYIPAHSDVLLGRGRGYFNHIGNIRYRTLIENLKERYDSGATKKFKMDIAEEVRKAVHNMGGRFLKDNDGAWVPIDDKAARQKIAHSFRALRAVKADNTKDSNSSSRKLATCGEPPTAKRMNRD